MKREELLKMFEHEINVFSDSVLNYEKGVQRFRLLLVDHKEDVQKYKGDKDFHYISNILKDLNKRVEAALNNPKNNV